MRGRRGSGVEFRPAVTEHAAPAIDRDSASVDPGAPGSDFPPFASVDAGPLVAELAPRVRVERERIWADGRGLDAVRLAERLVDALAERGVTAHAGVAALPVVAELAAVRGGYGDEGAARGPGEGSGPTGHGLPPAETPFLVKERTGWGWRRAAPTSPRGGVEGGEGSPTSPRGGGVERGGRVVAVSRGREVEWLAGLPLALLEPSDRLRPLLEGVGVSTVGALAALEREAVEVRFGAEVVPLWRLARGDDRRVLFEPVPRERPHGSIDFVDYVLTDPSRLLFTANALLGPICERLVTRGEHARTLRLTLPLANGDRWERVVRPARPTASRETWLRLVRGLFERLTVPDAVVGMGMEVGSAEEATVQQGDLFDRGFATATAVEAAVARLTERQLPPVMPTVDAHPLVERRGRWVDRQDLPATGNDTPTSPRPSARKGGASENAGVGPAPGVRDEVGHPSTEGSEAGLPGVGLQLLPEPRRIGVETKRRRDHDVPVRLRDRGGWREVVRAAGPDRISGGQWEASSYAREYYRCVTEEGVPLWIYRDGLDGSWYLHGWWD